MFVFFCCAVWLLYAIIETKYSGKGQNMCGTTDEEKREEARKRLLEAPDEERLWEAVKAYAGYPFSTAKGLEYTYDVRGNEIDLDISRLTLIVMIRRDGKALIPNGSTVLQRDDAVFVYSKRNITDAQKINI